MTAPIEDVDSLPGKTVSDHGQRKIPIAWLKEEHGEVLVPYGAMHLEESPEIEPGDEISEEDDVTLRPPRKVTSND